MQLSDIVDVVGVTPVPSPAPTRPGDDGGGEGDDGPSTSSSMMVMDSDTATTLPSETRTEDDSRIRCICGNEEDDGFTIQCDHCLAWQHAVCVGVARNAVPEVFLCEVCRPRQSNEDSAVVNDEVPDEKIEEEEEEDEIEVSPKSRRRPLSSANLGLSSGPLALNEITANIIATTAADLVQKYSEEWERVRLQMPRLAKDIPLAQVNFEQTSILALSSLQDLRETNKAVEIRELRLRNYGRRGNGNGNAPRLGIFAGEDIDPGAIIGEYYGHVQPMSVLQNGTKRIESVSSSFVLFCRRTPDLMVDSRKFGSILRYIRRSCRANCEVKLVLTPPSKSTEDSLHWCLFARNTIRENEELFLPFDYSEGNTFFRYECCCMYPELCLADEMPISDGLAPANDLALVSNKGSKVMRRNTSTSTSATSLSIKSSRTSSNATHASSSGTSRKMSREERKLQQYIEFFERMELAEKNRQKRSQADSGAASPPDSRSTKNNTVSPKKGRSSKAETSPSGKSKVNDSERLTEGDLETKQKSKSLQVSPMASSASSPNSSKAALPLKKMFAKSMAQQQSSEKTSVSVPSSPIKSPLPIKRDPIEDEGQEIVDVVDDSPSPPPNPLPSASLIDTPTKRKVSLSDYLSRRKTSPSIPSTIFSDSHATQESSAVMMMTEVVKKDPGMIEEESTRQANFDGNDFPFGGTGISHPEKVTTSPLPSSSYNNRHEAVTTGVSPSSMPFYEEAHYHQQQHHYQQLNQYQQRSHYQHHHQPSHHHHHQPSHHHHHHNEAHQHHQGSSQRNRNPSYTNYGDRDAYENRRSRQRDYEETPHYEGRTGYSDHRDEYYRQKHRHRPHYHGTHYSHPPSYNNSSRGMSSSSSSSSSNYRQSSRSHNSSEALPPRDPRSQA